MLSLHLHHQYRCHHISALNSPTAATIYLYLYKFRHLYHWYLLKLFSLALTSTVSKASPLVFGHITEWLHRTTKKTQLEKTYFFYIQTLYCFCFNFFTFCFRFKIPLLLSISCYFVTFHTIIKTYFNSFQHSKLMCTRYVD